MWGGGWGWWMWVVDVIIFLGERVFLGQAPQTRSTDFFFLFQKEKFFRSALELGGKKTKKNWRGKRIWLSILKKMSYCWIHSSVRAKIDLDRKCVDVSIDLSLAIMPDPTNTVRLCCRPTIVPRSIVVLGDDASPSVPCAFVVQTHAWNSQGAQDIGLLECAAGHEADLWERGNLVVTLPPQPQPQQPQPQLLVLRVEYTCTPQVMWRSATVCRPISAHDWLISCTDTTRASAACTWDMDVALVGGFAHEWTVVCSSSDDQSTPACVDSIGFHAERHLVQHPGVLLWTTPGDEASVCAQLLADVREALNQDTIIQQLQPHPGVSLVVLPRVVATDELPSCTDSLVWRGLILIDREQCLFSAAHIDPLYTSLGVLCEAMGRHIIESAITSVATAGDQWMVDGLAAWLGARCLAKLLGTNERKHNRLQSTLHVLREEDGTTTAAALSRPLAWQGHLFGVGELDTPVYRAKALVVCEMLEQSLGGGDLFATVVTQLLLSHRTSGLPLATRHLEQACIEAVPPVSSSNIACFFAQWVYCNGYPHLQVSFHHSNQSKTNKVRIDQRGGGGAYNNQNQNRLRFTGSLKFRIHELEKTHEQVRALPAYDECMVPTTLAGDAILPLTPASVVSQQHVPASSSSSRALPRGVAEYEFLCKSRVRRNRKRKRLEDRAIYDLPLDKLLTRHNDTPVFYMRADPQLTWFGIVVARQAPLNVLYQLLNDKELFGQCEAVLSCAQLWHLQLQPQPQPQFLTSPFTHQKQRIKDSNNGVGKTPSSSLSLSSSAGECTPLDMYSRALLCTLRDETLFFVVRALAGRCLVHSLSWSSTDRYARESSQYVLQTIRDICSPTQSPTQNDFTDVAHYRLKVGLIEALGDVCCASFCSTPTVDTTSAFGGADVRAFDALQQDALVRFLLDLLEQNNNEANLYSDAAYIGAILTSLGRMATGGILVDNSLFERLWDDLVRQLQRDQIFPSRHGIVGARALVALARVERAQHKKQNNSNNSNNSNSQELDYTTHCTLPGTSHGMRLAGFSALVHVAPVRGLRVVLPQMQQLLVQQLGRHDWRSAHDMLEHLSREITHQQCPKDFFQVAVKKCDVLAAWIDCVWGGATNHLFPLRLRCAFHRLYLVTWGAPSKFFLPNDTSQTNQRRKQARQDLLKHRTDRRI